jgi:hypothetical protein
MSDQLPTTRKPELAGGGAVVALVPQTLDEAYRLADALSRSGLTPYNIKTPEAVMACLIAGAELGFPPFQSLQSFAVINGRPSIYGAAVPALLWSRGFDIEESFEGEDPAYPDTMKAVCVVTRPNGKQVTRSYSVADSKTAKLWGKRNRDGSDTPWITNPKRMLQMRARGFAAQDGASDIIRGLPLYEEAMDFAPVPQEGGAGGTGMVDRLAARAVDVDAPPGFNVRQIAQTDVSSETLDELLDGDDIPAEKPKRHRRTRAEMEAARAAEAEAIARHSGSGGQGVENPTETDGAPSAEGEPDSSSDDGYDDDSDAEGLEGLSAAQDRLDAENATDPEDGIYRGLIARALSQRDVAAALTRVRQTEMWANSTAAEQKAWNLLAHEKLVEIKAPGPDISVWRMLQFISAGAPGGGVAELYESLKGAESFEKMTRSQAEMLDAAVKQALGD